MIKISKMADYAVVILSALARQPEEMMSATVIADSTKLPEPTVSKILKSLARAEIIQSTRGTNGGYKLKMSTRSITIAQVITAMDGPIAITACADSDTPDCSLASTCGVRGRWDNVNIAIRDALESVTLAEMIALPTCTFGQKKEEFYGRH
jgi:FeS assembly SUF system regulator